MFCFLHSALQKSSAQCFFRTNLRAFVAENTLRSVFSVAGFFIDLYIHGADPQAFAAVNAFAFVTVYTQHGKIAHGLEKHRDGTQILAERPIIFESEGKRNADNIVKCIPGEE